MCRRILTPAASESGAAQRASQLAGSSVVLTVNGGGDNDIIVGSEGNDTINGDDGNDVLFGGNGNDTISGGAGTDYIDGGAGTDSAATAKPLPMSRKLERPLPLPLRKRDLARHMNPRRWNLPLAHY